MRHSDFAIAVKATGEVVRSPAKNDLIVREQALPGKSCRKNGRKSTLTETAVWRGEGKVMRSRTGQIWVKIRRRGSRSGGGRIIVHIWQRKKRGGRLIDSGMVWYGMVWYSGMVGLLIVVRTPANLQTSKKLEYDWLPTSRTPGWGKPFSTDKRKKDQAVSSTQSNQRLNDKLDLFCKQKWMQTQEVVLPS